MFEWVFIVEYINKEGSLWRNKLKELGHFGGIN